MAYRRSITSRAKLFYQQGHQLGASFSHLHRESHDQEESHGYPISRNPESIQYFHRSAFGSINSFGVNHRARSFFQFRGIPYSVGSGLVFHRNFSSGSVSEGSGDLTVMNDVANVLGDKGIELAAQAAPLGSEVAAAAANSYFPVAALQYLIDYVHVYAGLNWWAAVGVTTIFIRLLQLPVSIHMLKVTSKLTLMRSDLEKLQQDWEIKGVGMYERQAQVKALYKQHGVTPLAPFKGMLISGPVFCSFFFAIRNMAEKVPSFKDGGISWFNDLTTPDSLYIFPVLTALTFLITVELNAQEGLEGNPTAGPVKMISRIFAALTVPLTLTFPKAIFCYWVPSNLFSLVYGYAVKKPAFKKFFGIPLIPIPPPSTMKSPFSFFPKISQLPSPPTPATSIVEKSTGTRTPTGSSSLSHRIKSMEKNVKARKKGITKTK